MTRRNLLVLPLAASVAPAQSEADSRPMFDGKTLDGWSIQRGPESAFYVRDGAIVIHQGSGFPAWLRYDRVLENFDFQCEVYMQGWSDSGIYLHAPEHGRPATSGYHIKLFHQADEPANPYSMGSIFPLIAPRKVNVKQKEWNTLRTLVDWPVLRLWVNGDLVQDVDVDRTPELRRRLRSGYLGISNLSYPLQFRNLRLRELPGKEKWTVLYDRPEHLESNWWPSEGEPNFQALGPVLRGDGLGHIATKEKYRDLEMRMYIRGAPQHNGGVLFRSEGKGLKGKRYEIQLHNVEEAHFPTGSLYYYKRSVYPKIEDDEWYLFQLFVRGPNVVVRINGEDVMEYDKLEDLGEGHVELQAHRRGYYTEFKDVRIKRL
jgi:hypothetical protein